MIGADFLNTLRTGWRQILGWGLGLGLWAFLILVVLPDVEVLAAYAELAEQIPPFVLQMVGTDAASLGTPAGFVSYGYFSYALLALSVFAVLAGLSITSGEEDSGELDLVLAQPLQRWRLILERFLAYTLMLAAILAVSALGLVFGNSISQMGLDLGRLVVAHFLLLPSVLLVMAVTLVFAVVVRRRALATGLATLFVIASYVVNFLSGAATDSVIMAQLDRFSYFSYYSAQRIVLEELTLNPIALPLLVAAVLIVVSLFFFERRDIGV
jgi:ABC-2 type transport system permease protein